MRMSYILLSFLILLPSISALDISAIPSNQTVLTSNIPLSPQWQNILQIAFKLPAGTPLTLQSAIILGILFLVVFFIASNVFRSTSLFGEKYIGDIVALLITLISAAGGGMYFALISLLGLSQMFENMGNWKGIGFIVIVVLLIVIAIIFKMVIHGIGKLVNKEEAEEAGFQVGKKIAESSIYTRIARKLKL